MDDATVPRTLALRIRRALGRVGAGSSGVDERTWRRQRDDLLDLLDASQDSPLTAAEVRRVIDLLAEGEPITSARVTPQQWHAEVDGIVVELLSLPSNGGSRGA
jgi:hypothetical protein